MLRVYLAIGVKSFQRSLAYRAANLAGIATNTFFAAVYVYVYLALYRNQGQVGGLDVQDAITYAILTQSLLMVMSAFGNTDFPNAVLKGDIATDLCRPVDFYLLWAATDTARGVYYFFLRGIPAFVLGWLLFGVEAPPTLLAGAFFLLSLALGVAISFAFRFITGSLAFWLTDVRGVHYLTNTLVLFFSGFIVPLNFFPSSLRAVAEALPFRALGHIPASIYLGKVAGWQAAAALLTEAAWLIVLVAGGRLLLGRLVRRLTIAGG